uniref:Uncharacterized protein n=1 Tax=Anguilla anguilla TaxID=7936 RepID=A0A0E9RHR2_ANGAN
MSIYKQKNQHINYTRTLMPTYSQTLQTSNDLVIYSTLSRLYHLHTIFNYLTK